MSHSPDWKGLGPGDQVEVGLTARALPNVAGLAVNLKALSTNSVAIFIGEDTVTTGTGFELFPGDGLRIKCLNANVVYAVTGTVGQRLCFVMER